MSTKLVKRDSEFSEVLWRRKQFRETHADSPKLASLLRVLLQAPGAPEEDEA